MQTAAVFAVVLLGLPSLAAAELPEAKNLTAQFQSAGLAIDKLEVYEIGGVVLIRGRAKNAEAAEAAGLHATQLGYLRVANLVQLFEPPDDVLIERAAERELTVHRSLDGCRFRIDSRQGVVHLAGNVQHELQKDVAIALLRNIDGVLSVQSTLKKF